MNQPESTNQPDHRQAIKALLRQAQAGDPQALTVLFETYRDQILRIARVRIGAGLAAKVDPEDIAQLTLVTAWRNLGTFDANEAHRLINWFAVIAENCIRDEAKKWTTEQRSSSREIPIDSLRPKGGSTVSIPIPGRGSTPSQNASASEWAEAYDRCLSKLPEHYREVIIHRQHSEMSWGEIAESLGSPNAKAAFQTHFRAMECLKELLEAEGFH